MVNVLSLLISPRAATAYLTIRSRKTTLMLNASAVIFPMTSRSILHRNTLIYMKSRDRTHTNLQSSRAKRAGVAAARSWGCGCRGKENARTNARAHHNRAPHEGWRHRRFFTYTEKMLQYFINKSSRAIAFYSESARARVRAIRLTQVEPEPSKNPPRVPVRALSTSWPSPWPPRRCRLAGARSTRLDGLDIGVALLKSPLSP